MLFRRISKHVKDQNWFAVVIDFVIVVVGVYIGIQVANWNDERANRITEQQYLQRLSADLEQTLVRNAAQLERSADMLSDMDVTLAALDACEIEPGSEDIFASGLYFLGRYNLPEFVSGTFQELNATGNFSLIRDIELRAAITDIYESIERTYLIDRQLNDRIVPKLNHVRSVVRFNSERFVSRQNGTVSYDVLLIDFESACRNTEFKNSIAAIREVMQGVDALTRRAELDAEQLKTIVDRSLGRPVVDAASN